MAFQRAVLAKKGAQAVEGGVLALFAAGHDLGHFRVGLLPQQVAHLVEMIGMRHDADLVDLLTLLKGRDAMLEHGAAGHKRELLGARTAEAAAGSAGEDEGDGVGHGGGKSGLWWL